MKAKLSILTVLAATTLFSGKVSAQETIVEDVNYNTLEQYIELANANNPRKKIFDAQQEGAKAAIPHAQMEYLSALEASYYYRPNERSAIVVDNPYLVTGFQFGVSVNVGTILQTPFTVKQARAQYKVSQLENEEYTIMLASEVKRRYYDYILALKDLKIKTNAAQNAYTLSEDLRLKFERAEITLEAYNAAQTSVTGAESEKVISEANLLKAKDALEEIIGTTLESVNN